MSGSVQRPGERRHLLGLDGLRAIAALGVIVYHVFPGWLPGGFLGVDVFFVLSGFLITSLLIAEHSGTGRIDLRMFWVRRLRRLMPALIACVAVVVPFAVLAGPDAYVGLRRQLLGIFSYTYNWIEIAFAGNYFDERVPLLFTNVWSLAVEEQFYLLWPLVVLVLLRRPGARWLAPLFLAVASVTAMLALRADANRVYLGTDTHAFGLMLGAVLAFAVPTALAGRLATLSPMARRVRAGLGWLGLAGVLASMWFTAATSDWLFPWGLLAAGGSTLLVVQALLPNVGAAGLAQGLSWAPLQWLGDRSYGLYLWHWPVWVVLVNYWPTATPWLLGVVAAGLTVVAAAASYRFVEIPIRRFGWRAAIAKFGVWLRGRFPGDVHRLVTTGGIVTAVALFAGVGLITSPEQNSVAQAFARQASAEIDPDPVADLAASRPISTKEVTGSMVTIIGDSVTKMAEPALAKALPGSYQDSKVNRNTRVAVAMLTGLREAGQLREYVVLGLATNAKILDSEISAVLDLIGPERKLVLITGFGPKRETWIWESNEVIEAWAKKRPGQVLVADWATAIAGHEELLYRDQTHPKEAGAILYAETVRKVVIP